MARITKTEAAQQLGIARSTLYKLLDQGVLSATPEGLIDSAELVRVAASTDRLRQRTRTSADRRQRRVQTSADTTAIDTQPLGYSHSSVFADSDHGRPQVRLSGRLQTSADVHERTYVDLLVDTLRAQLTDVRETMQREREAVQERERAYREQIERLTRMVDAMQQRYDRLLEAPRPPAAAPVPPSARRAPPRPRPAPAATPDAATSATALPVFDPRKHVLGKLCRRQHAYQDTGQSLLRLPGRSCLLCDRERTREQIGRAHV